MTPSSINADLRAFLFGVAFAATLGASPRVEADVPSRARALARTLFEEGRLLMNEKKFAAACPKLEESMRLDPAAGTQLNLAVCHEGEGKLATAWTEYNDALTQARRDERPERAELASSRLREVTPKLSWMTIALAPGADAEGLEVVLDGAAVGRAALGVPSPVDPGAHSVQAHAPGRAPFRADAQVDAPGTRTTVTIPQLSLASQLALAVDGTDASETERAARKRRTWGGALLGTGAASLVVGAIFGVRAIGQWSERNDACQRGCTAEGVARGDAAQTSAWVANIGIVAGVAAMAGGTYLLVTSRESASPPKAARLRPFPILSPTHAGFGLVGEL